MARGAMDPEGFMIFHSSESTSMLRSKLSRLNVVDQDWSASWESSFAVSDRRREKHVQTVVVGILADR